MNPVSGSYIPIFNFSSNHDIIRISSIVLGAHKTKSREVRSPTCEVLGASAKHLGAQSIFLGAPGYQAPVRQQP